MRSKEDLFRLISAMSKSEKRYFTLDARKTNQKGSKYLELFQAINAMDEYDEGSLKKQFPKNFSTDKIYLYDSILRSMRDYRSSKSHSARIKEMILDAKYLYERGLYRQSEEQLQKANALALALEDSLALLEINREKGRIASEMNKKNYEQIIERLSEQKVEQIELLNEEFDYLKVYYELLYKARLQLELKTQSEKEVFKKRFKSFAIDFEKGPVSIHAKRRYYQIMAMYHQLLADADQFFYYYSKVLDWWDEYPDLKKEEYYRFISDVSNYFNAAFAKQRYGQVNERLQYLESEKPSNIHGQARLFQTLSHYRLIYKINTGDTDNVDEIESEIEDGLNRYNIDMVSQVVILGNMAIWLFIAERSGKCLEWCGKILKKTKTMRRAEIRRGIHLLAIIATFDTEDIDRMEKNWRSVYRYFNKVYGRKKDNFEFTTLHYMRLIMNAPLDGLKDILIDFKGYLVSSRTRTGHNPPFGMDELLTVWVNSKLDKKPIAYYLGA